MQSVSPGYVAVATRAERPIAAEVTVDWHRDGNPETVPIAAATVRKQLSTGLPTEATLQSGTSVSSATIQLAGNLRRYQPYNKASDLYQVDVEGAPVTVDMGFRVGGAPELLRQITGTASDMSLAGPGVSLEVLDGSQRLQVPATIPVAVGYDASLVSQNLAPGSGLNTTWAVDMLAREGGYHASPPPRPECLLSVPLSGSLQAEVGEMIGVGVFQTLFDDGSVAFAEPQYAPGQWSIAPAVGEQFGRPRDVFQSTYTLAQAAPVSGTVTISGWAWIPQDPGPLPIDDQQWAVTDSAGLNQTALSLVTVASGATQLSLMVTRNGVTEFINGPEISDTGWTYVGARLPAGANGTTSVEFRVGSVSGMLSGTVPTGLGVPTYTIGGVAGAQPAAGVQIDAQLGLPGAVAWDDGFVPTAVIEAGDDITAIPAIPAGATCWSVLQDIATATGGLMFVDENDVFQSWGPRHVEFAAASTEVQADLVAADVPQFSMQRLAYRVRNVIRVAVSPLSVGPVAVIWQQPESDVRSIPPRSSITIRADLGGKQAFAVDRTGWVIPAGGALSAAGAGHSGYRACTTQDGTGAQVTNLVMVIEPAADGITMTISNPNSTTVWLVSPHGAVSPNGGGTYPSESDGKPPIQIVGRLIDAASRSLDAASGEQVGSTGTTVEWREPESVELYGERPLDIPANPWRQLAEPAAALARLIGLRTSFPKPQFGNLRVRGRPELQRGDRVTLTDASGRTGLDHELCIVYGASPDYTGGTNAVMWTDLVLEAVAAPGQLIMDVEGRDLMDSTDCVL